jgi:DNA-binding transcriptional ArsR family regulator
MATMRSISDTAMIKAISHPLRVKIIELLDDGDASPNELATQLGEGVTNIAYHVRTLSDLGIIKLVRTAPRRGATEHWYELVARPAIPEALWGNLPAALQDSLLGTTLHEIGRDVERAAASGGFDDEEMHLSRVPMVLDRTGWSQIAEVLQRALDEVLAIEKETTERLKKTKNAEAIGARSVIMLFETPQRRDRRSPRT